MASDSQSTHKSKDDENINSKGRHLNGNSSTTVGSEALDTPGLRRSARESSSKKTMPLSPASTQKSKQLEKQTPTTPPLRRKSLIVEKHMPNALRRSARESSSKKTMLLSPESTRKSKRLEKQTPTTPPLRRKSMTVEKHMPNAPRRLARESSSKKTMPRSPASTRKSERLEKQTPTTPLIRRKSLIIEKHMPNALRRSERGKKRSPSSSSGSKKFEKSPASSNANKPKEKKEKTVKQLICESREIKESEKQDSEHVRMPSKYIKDARAYRAFFMKNASNQVNATEKALEVEDGDSLQICKSDDGAHFDCTVIKKTGSPELVESTLIGITGDAKDSLVASHKVASFKRKGTEARGICLKRQRVDSVSTKHGLCSCKTFLHDSEVAIVEALQDQCSIPTEMQNGDVPSIKEQHDTGHGEAPQSHPNVPSDCNFEAPIIEPVVQSQFSPNENLLDFSSAGEIGPQPSTRDQNGACTDVETFHGQVLEDQCSLPDTEQVDMVQLQLSAPTHSSLVDDPRQRQISRMPLHFSLDPLQNELDRVSRDIEHCVKTHEDMKLELKADFEKEIEKVTAQIRKKYEIKLHESEVEFWHKKKDMEASHDQVLMNKVLAEAFRFNIEVDMSVMQNDVTK